MPKQRTIGEAFSLSGIGVHTGERSTVSVRPAEADTGIRFVRADRDDRTEIQATLGAVVDVRRGTTLGSAPALETTSRRGRRERERLNSSPTELRIGTVEHLLAALYAARIDNAVVAVDGPEIPIRDGSFSDFSQAIARVGTRDLSADARVLELSEPVSWKGPSGQSYTALPAEKLELVVSIDFDHPAIGSQAGYFRTDGRSFSRELGPARTFGFESEVAAMRAEGLALGASVENSLVLGPEGTPCPPLRFPDEFVRHKAGDLLGDLALLGGRLKAKIVADRPGHAGNVEFARKLRAELRRGSRAKLLDTPRIMEFLPHRYPMLLVDRVTEFESGKRITGIKNVTMS